MDKAKKRDLYHTPLLICWQFFKDFWEPDGTDEFWSKLIARQEAIWKEFGKTEYVLELTRVFVNEIERIEKQKHERTGA